MPTMRSSSPTTTSAVNENRRPPLTTFATRLIVTTRSWRSRPWGLIVFLRAAIEVSSKVPLRVLEAQTPAPGSLGEDLYAAVVLVAAAIEDAGLDSGRASTVRDKLANTLCLLHRPERAKLRLGPVRGHERVPALVIDQLGEQAAVRAVDRQARALGASAHLATDARAPPGPSSCLLQDCR